ncbi:MULTISPECIES: hypothetical protein [Ruegeria]|nr:MULTISPECIES: hypothetical protein [Ruegeria]
MDIKRTCAEDDRVVVLSHQIWPDGLVDVGIDLGAVHGTSKSPVG